MQKGNIGVTTENIFPVIKKFLYSDHEIFLREMVSNAVDATQKLKTLADRGDFKGELGDLTVQVKLDSEKGTLTISDRGIGMTEEEIDKYINQIAFSGVNDFLDKYKDNANAIIGHFGLGFYSPFMVSKKVEIVTKSYQEGAKAVKWSCDGSPEFTIEDARKIIETNMPLPARNEDSHDMLGTFAIVSNRKEMSVVPNTADELIDLLQARHRMLLSARPEKHPGLFKMQNNRAGNSYFVDYELVKGTLKKGFDFYMALRSPFAKAVYMLFMVSEIHPFDDGNGRVSRIMMNAELTHANECKILIPTVFRTDYLDALRKLTRQSDPSALIRALSRVQKFSSQLQTDDFETLKLQLERANAFSDSEEDILKF